MTLYIVTDWTGKRDDGRCWSRGATHVAERGDRIQAYTHPALAVLLHPLFSGDCARKLRIYMPDTPYPYGGRACHNLIVSLLRERASARKREGQQR